MVLTHSYEPYGELYNNTGSADSPFGFAGEWTDPSGMQYLRARYYSPAVGRFLSRDTWSGNELYPLTLNAWSYTNSNPVNFSDPSGQCAGFKSLTAPVNSIGTLLNPYSWIGPKLQKVSGIYGDAWETCKQSWENANAAYNRGDYGRAFTYATGITAASNQAGDRMAGLNHSREIILNCDNASFGDKFLAYADVIGFGFQTSLLVTPFVYAKYVAVMDSISIGEIGYFDEMLNPSMGHSGYYTADSITISPIAADYEAYAQGYMTAIHEDLAAQINNAVATGDLAQAQALRRKLALYATDNYRSGTVSLGGYEISPNYLDVAKANGYTNFNLLGKSYEVLGDTVLVNQEFMNQQISQGKNFGFTLGGGEKMGAGTRLEFNLLNHHPSYYNFNLQPINGFDRYFVQFIIKP